MMGSEMLGFWGIEGPQGFGIPQFFYGLWFFSFGIPQVIDALWF